MVQIAKSNSQFDSLFKLGSSNDKPYFEFQSPERWSQWMFKFLGIGEALETNMDLFPPKKESLDYYKKNVF